MRVNLDLKSWTSSIARILRSNYCVGQKLSDKHYEKFRLKEKHSVTHNTTLYVIDYPFENLVIPLGQHISIRASIEGHNVVRPYTPIHYQSSDSIHLLIKDYPSGKISQHMKSLAVGSQVELMGPIGHILFRLSDYVGQSITMVAGGTGIAPFYPILRELLNSGHLAVSVTLLYASKTAGDILLSQELEELQKKLGSKLRIVHFLEKMDGASPDIEVREGYVTKQALKDLNLNQTLFMICGPPAMEQYFAEKVLDETQAKVLYFTKSEKAVTQPATQENKSSTTTDKSFTIKEVAKHRRQNDCWMIVKDKVYNVSSFIDEHPGGYIIMDGAGIDATSMMYEDFPHSDEAIEQMKDYYIGELNKE